MVDHVFTDCASRTITLRDHPKLTATQIRDLVGDSPLILEIGCCECDDTAKFVEAMPKARIHCFEPDARPLAAIPEDILSNGNVLIHKLAISDKDELQDWHASTGKAGSYDDYYLSGSLSWPTGHLEQSPEIKFKGPVPIECMRLDTWYDNHQGSGPALRPVDFIWADVQGTQARLIVGGRLTLALTRWLYIECHPTPLYEEEPTQAELIDMLPGFEPMGLYEGYNILFRNRHIL